MRECTLVPHLCLRRHEQRADNTRKRLFEKDRDGEKEAAAVRANMVVGQRTAMERRVVRET